ncbi:MAG: hypothetical protein NVSMB10_04230 [Steroidobacteraceae bacterium]
MPFRVFTALAVVALAISTWILSSPAYRPAAVPAAQKTEMPGYYLSNAILTDYDSSGVPSIRLEADRIDQVDHGTEVALSNVRVHYESPNGQSWRLSGERGHILPGGNIIDVAGTVRLQGESTEHAGTALVSTDALTYDVSRSTVSTESDVRIDFGPRTLSSHGLVANLKERTMRLESKVSGRFER